MSVTYSAAAKTARMEGVKSTIDAGSGPGVLEIGTVGMAAVLASFTLNDPSGVVAGSVLTLSGFPKIAVASGSGTAAAARLKDSAGNGVITGLTVGTSGTDVVVDTDTVNAGQVVTITSAVLTHG